MSIDPDTGRWPLSGSSAGDDPVEQTNPKGVYGKREELKELIVRLSHEVQTTYRLHPHDEFMSRIKLIVQIRLDFPGAGAPRQAGLPDCDQRS
jgi:hypothetical protein